MSVIDYTEMVRWQRTAPLSEVDPEVYALIQRETARQEQNLELIASENITSRAVREAVGGSGGGRPDFAQAGGKHPEQLADALAQTPRLVAEQIRK